MNIPLSLTLSLLAATLSSADNFCKQFVSPDLDPNCLARHSDIGLLKEFFENINFEKGQQMTTKA